MNKYYDEKTGQWLYFDMNLMEERALPVGYDDKGVLPTHAPKFPNAKFREQFSGMVSNAIAVVNSLGLGRKMVFEKDRVQGFDGAGFIDGDLVFFVVREDKVGDPAYRYEMRCRDTVNMFEQRKFDGVVKTFVENMTAILKKD